MLQKLQIAVRNHWRIRNVSLSCKNARRPPVPAAPCARTSLRRLWRPNRGSGGACEGSRSLLQPLVHIANSFSCGNVRRVVYGLVDAEDKPGWRAGLGAGLPVVDKNW